MPLCWELCGALGFSHLESSHFDLVSLDSVSLDSVSLDSLSLDSLVIGIQNVWIWQNFDSVS